ncbi:MAG: hypothetical protein ACW974_06200, partial [Candidatus Thorarchaeota archaeon]
QEDVSLSVAFLAASHAWWTRASDTSKSIMSKYPDEPIIQVWRFLTLTSHSDRVQQYTDFREAFERALAASPEPWMQVEIHLLHAHFLGKTNMHPNVFDCIALARGLIIQHPELECFNKWVQYWEVQTSWFEGRAHEVADEMKKNIDSAQSSDDILLEYQSRLAISNILKHSENRAGIEAFEKTYEIAQNLGVPYYISETMNDASFAYKIAGEYDLAIESIHGSEETLPSGKGYNDTSCHILSGIYALLGNGEEALKWANNGFKYLEGQSVSSILHLRRARALLLLGRHAEADDELMLAKEYVMKLGIEVYLGWYYLISGLQEKGLGALQSAVETIKQGLEIFERVGNLTRQNEALMALAQIEMDLALLTKRETEVAVTGYWMARLENQAHKHGLPGIAMQAAILKADFHRDLGQYKDARQILTDALEISDSLGVRTLRKMMTERIEDLDRLLQEA